MAKAAQIKAAFEIGRRLSTQTLPYKSKELTNPKKVYQLIKSKLKDYHLVRGKPIAGLVQKSHVEKLIDLI